MRRRRGRIRAVSFLLAAFVVVGAFAFIGWNRAAKYEAALEASYRRSVLELAGNIDSIHTSLSKGLYVNDPTLMVSLASDIWRQSYAALGQLSNLPIEEMELKNVNKFVAQVGGYAQSLAKRATTGDTLTQEDKELVSSLTKTASYLSKEMYEYGRKHDDWANIKMLKNDIQNIEDAKKEPTYMTTFTKVETEFPAYPSVVYDGPFSDHISEMQPQFLAGKEAVTKEEAKARAATFLNVPASTLTVTSEGGDKIKTWTFTSKNGGGAQITVELTQIGGYLLNMTDSRPSGDAKLSKEEAIAAAQEFLSRAGYGNMEERYYLIENGRITISFTYKEKDIVVYPDQIEVSVCMNSGNVTTVQAESYIMSHAQRELTVPALSKEAASSHLNGDLTLRSEGQLCIIPTDGKHEMLCYEFQATGGEDEKKYLVYLDANSGKQTRIFMVAENEQGTLVQ